MLCVAGLVVGVALVASYAAPPPVPISQTPVGWTNQFGTSASEAEDSAGVAVGRGPSGSIYVAGTTYGAFTGQINLGDTDAFVARYDKDGRRLWLRQFGSSDAERTTSLAVSSSGDLYVVGLTDGDIDGGGPGPFGGFDGFVARYDRDGNQKWIRQFGSASIDTALGTAAAGSNEIYVVGRTSGDLDGAGPGPLGDVDGFIVRFDRNGTMMWIRHFGSSDSEVIQSVAVRSSSELYVTGFTEGDVDGPGPGPLGGPPDGFVARFDRSGNLLWARHVGTDAQDAGVAVAAAGSTEIYVVGDTDGDIDGPGPGPIGAFDSFVARYDRNGTLIWARQFGSTGTETVHGVAAKSGTVYVSGDTEGDVDGAGSGIAVGDGDSYLVRFDSTGATVWTRQYGTTAHEEWARVILGSSNRPVVAGTTEGSLWSHANAGFADGYLSMFPTS